MNVKESVHQHFRQRINGLKDKFRKRQSENQQNVGKTNRFNQLFNKIVNTKQRITSVNNHSKTYTKSGRQIQVPQEKRRMKSLNPSISELTRIDSVKERVKKIRTVGGPNQLRKQISKSSHNQNLFSKKGSGETQFLQTKKKRSLKLPVTSVSVYSNTFRNSIGRANHPSAKDRRDLYLQTRTRFTNPRLPTASFRFSTTSLGASQPDSANPRKIRYAKMLFSR